MTLSRYKENGYGHPEKKLLNTSKDPMFSDDEAYLLRQAKSTLKGVKLVIKDIMTSWEGKDKTDKIGKELFKLNTKAYEAEQEVKRLTKGD